MPEEANSMTINISTDLSKALDAALNAASSDGNAYVAGWDQFWGELPNGSIGDALSAALNAAAANGDAYIAGESAFRQGLDGSWRSKSPTFVAGVKSKTSRNNGGTRRRLH